MVRTSLVLAFVALISSPAQAECTVQLQSGSLLWYANESTEVLKPEPTMTKAEAVAFAVALNANQPTIPATAVCVRH